MCCCLEAIKIPEEKLLLIELFLAIRRSVVNLPASAILVTWLL